MDLGYYKWYQTPTSDDVPVRGVDLGVVPHRLEEGKSDSEDAGPQRGVDLGAVPHRLEEGKSVSENAGPQRGWIVMSHIVWGGVPFIRVWKPSPRFTVLRGSPKGKAQRGQYLLAVDRAVTNGIRARHRTMCQPSRCSPKGGRHEAGGGL